MRLTEQAEATSDAAGAPFVLTQKATRAERFAAKMTEKSFLYAVRKLSAAHTVSAQEQ